MSDQIPKPDEMAVQRATPRLPAQATRPAGLSPSQSKPLPNATIIYGIGASLLFVAAFFLLLSGRWFTALIVIALGLGLGGFAWQFLKHQD